MDPVAIGAVLAAIAGGVGDGLGEQLWAGVCALVRRPFHHRRSQQPGAAADGSAQLTALERAPGDQQRAIALAEALVARAAADSGFATAPAGWWEQVRYFRAPGRRVEHHRWRQPVRVGAARPRLHRPDLHHRAAPASSPQ